MERTTTTNTKKTVRHTYSKEDIDYFMTSWNGKCYLIPRNECGSDKLLRFTPPKNGQVRGVNYAKDYEIEVILQKYES